MRSPIGKNLTHKMAKLVKHNHPSWNLKDLKGVGVNINPGHAGRSATDVGTGSRIDRVGRIRNRSWSERGFGGLVSHLRPRSHRRDFASKRIKRERTGTGGRVLRPNSGEVWRGSRSWSLCRC